MEKANRSCKQKQAVVSFVVALGVCWLIAGDLRTILFSPLLLAWLAISTRIVYAGWARMQQIWQDGSQVALDTSSQQEAESETTVNDDKQPTETSLSDSQVLFLSSVHEVLRGWQEDADAGKIADAFLGKMDSGYFLDPNMLMHMEIRLRDKLPDGQFGACLFWVTGYELQSQRQVQGIIVEDVPEEANRFYRESFYYFVKLLKKNSPSPQPYPFMIYSQAAWLLLRDAAIPYFAADLESDLFAYGLPQVDKQSLGQVLAAYVRKYDERTAYDPANMLSLSYLLVQRQFLQAPAVYDNDLAQFAYGQHKNVLLLQDLVKMNIAAAFERQKLERFERELLLS